MPTRGVEDDRQEHAHFPILNRARAHAKNSGVNEMSSGHILVALFAEYQTFAVSELNC